MEMEISSLVKVLFPAAGAFFVGIAITPIVTHYLYTYRAWKKKAGKGKGYGGGNTPIFDALTHQEWGGLLFGQV